MISADEARRLATEGLVPLDAETVPLHEALHRAAARDIAATRPLPGFHNSAMDGYAVRHADLAGDAPRLPIGMKISAGDAADRQLPPGTVARIFTGAPLPQGADTVIMQEDAETDGHEVVFRNVPPLASHVRYAGEDIAVGEPVVARGQTLHAGRIAMLAAQGHPEVSVYRRPRVAIVPNGDELVPIGDAVGFGQVPNTNSPMLAAQVRNAGGEPWPFAPVRDDLAAITEAMREAAAGADLVLTTGGMSVGDFDHARDALRADGELSFYKVAVKPGKPLGLGRLEGTPILGLPGNPVSTFVGFELFGRPMVRTIGGFTVTDRPAFQAVLQRSVPQNRTRPEYVRCDILPDGTLQPWPKQGSSIISSLLHSDALAKIPMGEGTIEAGTLVEAIDLRR
ncbi:MAG: gephyrin-like molybdotransferase Glp [Myxococcota bacterium]